MKNYEEFKNELLETLKKVFAVDDSFAGVEVFMEKRYKNNITVDALFFTCPGKQVMPSPAVNPYYKDYQEKGLMYVVDEILGMLQKSMQEDNRFSLDFLDSKEAILERVYLQLVSKDLNTERIQTDGLLCHDFLDLTYLYRIYVKEESLGIASALVNKKRLEELGKTEEELFEIALRNTQRLFPASIGDLGDILQAASEELYKDGDMSNEQYEEIQNTAKESKASPYNMICIRNNREICGAAVITYPGIAEKVSSLIGGDYYIIPSSIHEVLVMREELVADEGYMRTIIGITNANELAPDEVLSYSLYKYDSTAKEILCLG